MAKADGHTRPSRFQQDPRLWSLDANDNEIVNIIDESSTTFQKEKHPTRHGHRVERHGTWRTAHCDSFVDDSSIIIIIAVVVVLVLVKL